MLRAVDISISLLGLILLSPIFVLVLIAIRLTSPGPALFLQERVGHKESRFICYKLRTMSIGTPHTATHLVNPCAVTAIGRFLRNTKLDEIPQLWNVLRGEMSLVGPRPCLPSQHELIKQRRLHGVFANRPGITGISQIEDIDMSNPVRLAESDSTYKPSLFSYFRILGLTFCGKGRGDRVRAT